MADLNPAFANQGGSPLPVLFGYGNGSGNEKLAITDPYNNQFSFRLNFDGECDGWEQAGLTATYPLWDPDRIFNTGVFIREPTVADLINFHAGRWTPIGAPNTPSSTGPDQGVDEYFSEIPTITPPQSFSGICNFVYNLPYPEVLGRSATVTVNPLAPYGIFRGARVRYFDAEGNVYGYGFSTNPTWHIMEALLRFKFKRQQPQIAGLTAAEKAVFNWPAIAAHAARNDYVLANGWPRFMGNYVFAAQATLGSMLETMLRCCRSYIDDPGGKIGIFGHDATNSGFTMTGQHVIVGSFSAARKDLTRAPNVFVPKYRDLNIAALISVNTATVNDTGNSAGSVSIPAGSWAIYFDTGGVNPFVGNKDVFYYGDSYAGSGSAILSPLVGDYLANYNPDPTVPIPGIWCNTPPAVATSPYVSVGGYIGTQTSRFQQRAPTTVQHRRHQLAAGAPAPGIAPVPNIVQVQYDCGNMTYDQANRLMQWMCNTQLGIDQPGWTPPMTGTMKVAYDAVDVNGNAFLAMRPGEGDRGDGCGYGRFTMTDTVDDPGFAGEYIITKMKINHPSKQEPMGSIEISFISFVGAGGYPDESAPPDDSLRTINSAALKQLGKSNQMNNVAWIIQSTPSTSLVGGLVTLSIPDLTLWLLGAPGANAPLAASWPGLTPGTQYILWVDLATGSAPVFGSASGTTSLPAGSPSYRYKIMVGTFNGTNDFTSASPYKWAIGTE